MSGTNPFRRKNPVQQSFVEGPHERLDRPELSNLEPGIHPLDTDIPRPTKSKTVKTVRIISPHSADSDYEGRIHDAFQSSSKPALFSPPPERTSFADQDEELEDPFQEDLAEHIPNDEDGVTQRNTLQNALTEDHRSAFDLKSRAPNTSFKRASAAPEQPGTQDTATSSEQHSTSVVTSSSTKTHYDVDDFKRLLLSGEQHTAGSTAPRAPTVSFGASSSGDSSSVTDTSSLSRQSLFEPATGVINESPRTSREVSPSGEEVQRPVNPAAKPEKVKPSTPRHRHGKLVKSNTFPNASPEDLSSPLAAVKKAPEARREPSASDDLGTNTRHFTLQRAADLEATGETNSEENVAISSDEREADGSSIKRAPPAPPVSRKSKQTRPLSFPSVPEQSASTSNRATSQSPPVSKSPPSFSATIPPPPPPRRSGPTRSESSSSTPTLAPTVSGSEQSRPPLQSSRSSTGSTVKIPQTMSQSPGSPSKATPPLPPPRRRGSSQSSYTPSRLSGDYRGTVTERLRSDSSASSISHLAMTPVEPVTEKQDIMADLNALQREVDELRGKIGK